LISGSIFSNGFSSSVQTLTVCFDLGLRPGI
jgi:hypothetical protein